MGDSRITQKTSQLSSYFVRRQNIEPSVVEGRNYTSETLFYMTPANRADEIATKITDKYGDYKFALIEICAGIGGNTMAFADNSNIGLVISYEEKEDRRLMLKRNIKMYGDNLACKVIVPD